MRGEIIIMDSSGDDNVYWDPQNDKSIENARKKFEKYIKKGYAAFRLNEKENKIGRALKEFPTFAAKLVFIPPMAGG